MASSDDLVEIIQGCKAGDADSFSSLIDAYAGNCYGYFYRLSGDRELSDELLSELFTRIVSKIGTYRGGSFEGWLFTIASNIFRDYLRAKCRQEKLIEAKKEELASRLTDTKSSGNQRIDRLQTELLKLDQDTRELIMLRFYSQLSFKEIAKMRAEPIGTTLSKVHRGLKKLRQMMEK